MPSWPLLGVACTLLGVLAWGCAQEVPPLPTPSPPQASTATRWRYHLDEVAPNLQLAGPQGEWVDFTPAPGFTTQVLPVGTWPEGAKVVGHRLHFPTPGVLHFQLKVEGSTLSNPHGLIHRPEPNAEGFRGSSLFSPFIDFPGWYATPELFPGANPRSAGDPLGGVRLFATAAELQAWFQTHLKAVQLLDLAPGGGPWVLFRMRFSSPDQWADDGTIQVWSNRDGHLKLVLPTFQGFTGGAITKSADALAFVHAPPGFSRVRSFAWDCRGGSGSYTCQPGEGYLPGSPDAPATAL